MYSTCIHCNAKLGANELIAAFPVGRRLAFDGAKGRLWVVCPKCHRWNLSPLEERWEAIEQCEREFRGTRLRAFTDNIGLAKTREGLELVRVGEPHRPEMAAWRYAREFSQRWKTRGLPLAGGVVALGAMNGFIGVAPVVAGATATVLIGAIVLTGRRSIRVRAVMPDGRVTVLKPSTVHHTALVADGASSWALTSGDDGSGPIQRGAGAERLIRAVLTAANFRGGSAGRIRGAESLLDAAGSTDRFIRSLARESRRAGARGIADYPWDIKLALEMAFHEESERCAMEGELAQLADEWAVAEEIAGIVDDMFVPEAVLNRHGELVCGMRP